MTVQELIDLLEKLSEEDKKKKVIILGLTSDKQFDEVKNVGLIHDCILID